MLLKPWEGRKKLFPLLFNFPKTRKRGRGEESERVVGKKGSSERGGESFHERGKK